MKAIVVINTEFQGNIRKFDKYFKNGKITFGLDSIKTELMPNEYGELYSIVDANIEQGKRFIVSVRLGFDVDLKTKIDFSKCCHVSKGCNMVMVETRDFEYLQSFVVL